MSDSNDPELRVIGRDRADAIHRALLAGLLGNVGVKGGTPHEFSGARGTKFSIFPGSALFKRNPPWVMAAELVETTRLYARTVGPAKAEWIERLAEHLVKRTYSDEHWSREHARVEAFERVTLYGLVIVPRRPVHYGPIEPKLSRDLFIYHALVRGEYRTSAEFMRANAELIRQVQTLEAKARRRDVLVDEPARVKFYDARVPQRVYNGHEFEKWRRQAEKANPRLLFMSRADLMLHGAEGVTAELYPDELKIDGVGYRLDYVYEPGDPDDGVTVNVPLAALNPLPAERLEWLVPGMLAEKVVTLIRTLPKPLRIQFIPAPDYAEAATKTLVPGEGSLIDALALYLGKRAGIQIPRSAFAPEALPDSLRMNCRVVDASGRVVARGRGLAEIRRKLGVQARDSFAALPPSEYHRDDLVRWDFGDLPESVELKRHGLTLLGYPTLVDKGPSVSLRVLDSPAAARASMRAGLRRLFMLQLGQELKYLARNLPGIEQICLHYATIGNCDELKQDLVTAAAERAFFDGETDPAVRTREQFAARAEAGWRRLAAAGKDVGQVAADSLVLSHALAQQLSQDFPPLLLPSVGDLREQLAHLMPRSFLASTPAQWLPHLPRYLKGMQLRLQKLMNAGLGRDAQQAAQVTPLWRAYLQRADRRRAAADPDPALELYGWMLEELRVSLFAQELKTSIPVSVKRLEAQWEQVLP